jgi:small-conductance mechanosensitive channel
MIVLSAASRYITDVLAGMNVPYAEALGSPVTFLVATVLLYVVGRAVVVPLVDRSMAARGVEEVARRPMARLAKVLVGFLAVGIAFGVAGYGNFLASLATIAAAATLAIGFALQDVIKNVVAGVFIFTDKPFQIGDWIEWDGHAGIVEDISFRVSRVRTFDNELLTVPNSQLTDGVIKNPVAKGKLRIKPMFGIGYEDDADQAAEIVVEEAENHPDILDDPAPTVRLTELADSYVGLQSRIWIEDPARSDFVRIRGEYMQAVKDRFDDADITIPFPQRELSGGLAVDPEALEA